MKHLIQTLKACVILVLFVHFQSITAQTTFQKTYAGNNWDFATSTIPSYDGGFMVAGYTYSFGAGKADVNLTKLDDKGVKLFSKTYGGIDYDFANAIIPTEDSGYIMVGFTYSYGSGSADVYVIKTNKSGTVQWSTAIGGSNFDEGRSVIQTQDGGYAIAGYTRSFGSGNTDVYLVKIDTGGNLLWTKTFGGTKFDIAHSITETAQGNLALVGWTESYNVTSRDCYLITTDSKGVILWSKTYGGSGNEYAHSIKFTNDLGFVIVGETDSYGVGQYDAFILKVNYLGQIQFFKAYGGDKADGALSVEQTNDGGYICLGHTNSFGAGNFDLLLAKFLPGGTLSWSSVYGGNKGEFGKSVIQTASDGYLLTGFSASFEQTDWDMYLVQTDENGESGCHELDSSIIHNQYFPPIYLPNDTTGQGGVATTISVSSVTAGVNEHMVCFTCDISLIADFTLSKSDICIGENVNFTNISQNGTKFIWLKNNTVFGSTQNASTTFNSAGSHEVTLIAIKGQCADTISHRLTVFTEDMTASFTHTVAALQLTCNNTTQGAQNYLWTFGDGQSSTNANPVHNYDYTGMYILCLYAYSICDTDTTCVTVSIFVNGIDDFSNNNPFKVYPNPSPDIFNVILLNKNFSDVEFSVVDINGKPVHANYEFDFTTKGNNSMRVDLTGARRGIYILRIRNADAVYISRLVLTN